MRLPFLLLVATVLSSARSLHRPAIPAELIRRDDDLKIQTTCRWTNCGEGCPAGFTPVLRADGNRGEVMWDHTHCYEQGMQTFCCPGVSTEWPTCRWSGHKNSGKCQPGCPAGEVEVGTLNFGCKSGHQSACCTHSYAVAAYGQCGWVVTGGLFCSLPSSPGGHSAAPCPDSHPQFIFSAKAGFGGEVPCVLGELFYYIPPSRQPLTPVGEKNYCCTSETKLWKNCGWHNKETSRFPQDVCEPSCPKNQVLLGMQKGECSEGEAAYCCEGLVESHPNLAPNWQPLLESFQQNLNL
jgi:chitinase